MTANVMLKEYDSGLVAFGFYPATISKQKISIADIQNDRQLDFVTDEQEFKKELISEVKDIPEPIKKVVNEDKQWFDDYIVVKPKKIKRDPFLFGLKDRKYYFICCWNIHGVWDI